MRALTMILVFGMLLSLFTGTSSADKDRRHGGHDTHTAKFYGVVESMPVDGWEGIWVINGRDILVNSHTLIEEKYGKTSVGVFVEVKGDYSGKTFTAYEIEVKGDKNDQLNKSYNSKFYGVVESMPEKGYEGVWVVDGREVLVNKDTFIEETHGKASVGVYVKVKGNRSGKTITAYKIEVKGNRR